MIFSNGGIGLRLRLAFGVVAATTIVATLIALWAFRQVQDVFRVVAGSSFPATVAALKLKAGTQEVTATLRALATADDAQAREVLQRRTDTLLAEMPGYISVLKPRDERVASELSEVVRQLQVAAKDTGALTEHRQMQESRKRLLLTNLRDAQQKIAKTSQPVLTAANAELLAATRRLSVTGSASVNGLIDSEFSALNRLVQARSESFRIAALAADAKSGKDLRRPSVQPIRALERSLESLDANSKEVGAKAIISARALFDKPSTNAEQADDVIRQAISFDGTLAPQVQKLTVDLVKRSEQISLDSTNAIVVLVAQQVGSLSAIQRSQAEANQLVGLAGQAANATNEKSLNDLRVAAMAADIAVKQALGEVRINLDLAELRKSLSDLQQVTFANQGLFANSAAQISLAQESEKLVAYTEKISEVLAQNTQHLTESVSRDLDTSLKSIGGQLDNSSNLLAVLATISAFIAIVLGGWYVGSRIVGRLTSLSSSMNLIAHGRLDMPIPQGGNDEISKMADALTVFKAAMKAQQDHAVSLQAAKDAADAATKAKSDFLANMSHEFRTPLTAILGYLQLAGATKLTPTQESHISRAQIAAKSLASLIESILDFSKVEAGKLELEQIDFETHILFDNLASVSSILAEEKGLELVYAVEPDVPEHANGDALRIGQVLLNLVNNAIKFTSRGEVTVAMHRGHERVLNGRREIELIVSVKDTGIGMSSEQMTRLFKSFSQADTSTTRQFGGTGLGLAISRQLVQLMGGDIAVTSSPGKGAEFKFNVWLGEAQAPVSRKLETVSLKGLRALVVDDNEAVLMLLGRILGSFGMLVQYAESGTTALTALDTARIDNQLPDLILLDWRMPEMDGVEVARRIRAVPTLKADQLPIILMVTAMGRERVIDAAKNVSIDGVLAKPLHASSLFEEIARVKLLRDGVQLGTAIHPLFKSQINKPEHVMKPLHGVRVLVAEDNEMLRDFEVELLSSLGARVNTVTNGKEAVAVALSVPLQIDIVLMDVQMPELDGRQATQEIRKRWSHTELPIVAMTAHAMDDERELCLAAGMNDHVSKPIDKQKLINAITRWVEPRVKNQTTTTLQSEISAQTPTNEIVELLPDIPGFNMQDALYRVDGDSVMLKRMFKTLPQRYASVSEQIKRELVNGHQDSASRIAHSLRGVAATLGGIKVAEAAHTIERYLNEVAPADVSAESLDRMLSELEQIYQPVLSAITQWVGQDSSPVITITTESIEGRSAALAQIRVALTELNQLLESKSIRARRAYAQLRPQLEKVDPRLVYELQNAIDRLDFTLASSLLEPLLQSA